MSGLNSEQTKQSSELEPSSPGLIQLMTKLVEQNTMLIQQASDREALIIQLIEQNDEILSELIDQEDDHDPTYLDMD